MEKDPMVQGTNVLGSMD